MFQTKMGQPTQTTRSDGRPGYEQEPGQFDRMPTVDPTRPKVATDQGKVHQFSFDRFAGSLGPYASLFGNQPIYRNEIPALQLAMGFDTERLAEQDRRRAFGELDAARSLIGTTPSFRMAGEFAQREATNPMAGNALRNQGAVASDDMRRQMAGEFAQRGIGGIPASVESALASQNAMAGYNSQAAGLDQAAIHNAIQTLAGLGSFQEQSSLDVSKLIADLFASTERQAPDLSGLLEPVKDPWKPVGHNPFVDQTAFSGGGGGGSGLLGRVGNLLFG